ncbi:MAG: alpha/beta fold hydrolase [Bacteroidota bacterium]
MVQGLFSYNGSRIAWYRYGTGPRTLLCFHGYGEEGTVFSFLEKYIGHQYTMYAIDLPYHGKTDWKESIVFTSTGMLTIIDGIVDGSYNKLSLLGFSLGGRVALGLYQSQPDRIEKLILLAPDGFKINFWYWLSTQTRLGNKFFAFTMKHPGWFFGFLKLLNKVKLINASIFKFVDYYISNPEVRRLLYTRWTTLRKIKPDLAEIKDDIRRHSTPVRLLYGKHDRIILSSTGEKFKKGIDEYCTLTVIPSGHQVLHEKHVDDIVRGLLV